jgi:hypothetical protein
MEYRRRFDLHINNPIMKKSFALLSFLICSAVCFGQYTITQNIGSGNTLVRVPTPGGFQASLINRTFTDTASANLTPIKFYVGAQIYTTSDNVLRVRNDAATAWIIVGQRFGLEDNLMTSNRAVNMGGFNMSTTNGNWGFNSSNPTRRITIGDNTAGQNTLFLYAPDGSSSFIESASGASIGISAGSFINLRPNIYSPDAGQIVIFPTPAGYVSQSFYSGPQIRLGETGVNVLDPIDSVFEYFIRPVDHPSPGQTTELTLYGPKRILETEQISDSTDYNIAVINRNNGKLRMIPSDLITGASAGIDTAMDIFLVAGQSNARGMSGPTGAANSPNPTPNTVYQYYGSFGQVTDEVGDANTGSAWPSFGITWNNITGRKVCFIPTAVNSSAQVAAADLGSGNWDVSGTLYGNSITQINAAMAAVAAAGYTPVFRGVLWSQGETDAVAINGSTITQTDYTNALTTMVSNYRGVYGTNMPFYIFKTGTRTDQSDVGYASIRAAQETFTNSNPLLNKMAFRNAFDFVARLLMVDVVHYSQAGYNEMGRIGAESVSNYVTTESWQKQGTTSLYTDKPVGIGLASIPAAYLHVSTTGFGNPIYMQANHNNADGSIKLENTNSGSNAATGMRFYNDGGIRSQILLYSSASSNPGANAFIIHTVPAALRLISNSGDIEFATVSTSLNNVKSKMFNNGQFLFSPQNVSTPTRTNTTAAAVEIQSTTQGFLLPRMTMVQRDAIVGPVEGLSIYQTDNTPGVRFYDGASWVSAGGGSSTWNGITNPTGTQTLTFDDGELNAWTISSNTETFHTYTANSLTSGTGISMSLNGLTSGNGISITSTSTAKTGANTLLNLNSSGANAASSIINRGATISVTNTGTTSENRALELTASGATTNWAAYATAGNFRTVGAAGYYALNSAGTGGVSMTYDNSTIATLGTTGGGIRLDLEAASSTILARRPFTIGIGIDFGNNVALDVYKSAGGTSNIQNWRSSGGTVLANVNQSGRFFIGNSTSATALLHIAASTAAANTGQIKLEEGLGQTTPENGTLNYVNNNIQFTETSTDYILAKTLTATATLDFDLSAVNYQDLTITVTGAAVNDAVSISVDPAAWVADVTYSPTVTATNTVTVRCSRVGGGGAANPASGTFRASVIHY